VIHLCPSYLKDGWQLVRALRDIPTLPPDAVCYTADAVPIYSNTNTGYGIATIATIARWLELHSVELPPDLPTALVLDGIDAVMRCNVFSFGSRRSLQLDGTAMGTSCACNSMLLFTTATTKIDDTLIIQQASSNGFANFVSAMNDFGTPSARLEWKATPPGRAVDFLDLHIRLDPTGLISSDSFQNLVNLYLEIVLIFTCRGFGGQKP
jgi:hypothetical protein